MNASAEGKQSTYWMQILQGINSSEAPIYDISIPVSQTTNQTLSQKNCSHHMMSI